MKNRIFNSIELNILLFTIDGLHYKVKYCFNKASSLKQKVHLFQCKLQFINIFDVNHGNKVFQLFDICIVKRTEDVSSS
jgi:hypothetical protein